jgi:tetratricopeptide (TPR) repeat protein
MIDHERFELSGSALRDYGGDPRLSRVWRRLEAEVDSVPTRSVTSRLRGSMLGVALFVGGVVVGRGLPSDDGGRPVMVAEPVVPVATPQRVSAPALGQVEATPRQAPPARPHRAARAHHGHPPVAPTEESPGAVEPATHVASPASSQLSEWQRLVESGDFQGARAALDRGGGFDAAIVSASPEQLMSLVDVARASGGREQAVRALRRLVQAFPGAPEAPLAAWTLGNLLEQSGDRAGAAEAYILYRRLSPEGDFAEDAAAREVEVALSQSNVDLAGQLLDQYEKDYPNGRRLEELREELSKLSEEAAEGDVPDEGQAVPAAPPADPE